MSKNRTLPILMIAISLLLAGCVGSPTPNFLAPNSMVSAQEAQLFYIILYMGLGVFVLVEGLLIYNILRFRRHSGDNLLPQQKYGNNKLEVIWTAIPILLVGTLFGLTIHTINVTAAPKAQPGDVNVTVKGHQWWWEFDYPDLGITTANELHVPVGKNVYISVTSVDVVHSFWVPQLSHKMDAIPGQTNHIWFNANKIGDYYGYCSEYCGLNHANMRIKVVVESQADFDAWVKNQQLPPVQPQTAQQQQAYAIITKGACINCHTLGSNKAINPIGPNLTHLMSRSVFAGATYDLNEQNLRQWLTDNQAMKPGNDMNVKLNQTQIDALMSYLTQLK